MNEDSKKIKIYFRLHNGNGCILNLAPSFTLQHTLSLLLNEKLCLPPSYRLIINGHHVRNYSSSIKQLGITQNTIIHIEQANIQIKTLSKINLTIFWEGDKIVLEARYNDSVFYLKQRLQELYNIHTSQQLLVFKGCKLKNQKTLQYYRLQPGSMICLQILQQKDNTNPSKSAKRQDQLLNSVLSLNNQKISSSRTTLFRSDSIGERKYKQTISSYDVQIKQKKIHYEEEGSNQDGQLRKSITFNTGLPLWNPYQSHQVYSMSADSSIDSRKYDQLTFTEI